ncbi:MAG TPA: DUF5696 domain-containing protein, partial [Bacillota bacterium]|nr:DUF5696 domain-containing protein [Bacillota bacterium]
LTCFPAMAADESDEEEEKPTLDTAPYLTNIYGSVEAKIATMTEGITAYGMTMYYDALSGEVAVRNNTTGMYLMTNPYDVSSAQTSSGGSSTASIKQDLMSQIIITYTENDKESEMSSFKDAAIDLQIVCKQIRGGYRFEYTLGREEERVLVPRRDSVERFESLYLEPMYEQDPSNAKRFASFYLKKDPNDPTLTAKAKLQMTIQLPITKKMAVYVIDPSVKQNELLRMEKWVKAYTKVTYEIIEEGHTLTEYEGEEQEPALFKLAIEYTLTEQGLDFRCSANNIRFDSSNFKLTNIVLLPYMGAARVTIAGVTQEGYVFTPDGSGTIVSFDNIAAKNVTISDKLYGQDYAFHTMTSTGNKEAMRVPVFGLYYYTKKTVISTVENDDGEYETVETDASYYSGFMAIIEEGDSLADITLENGGATHNYVSVYTEFNPRPSDTYSINGGIASSTGASWTVSSKRKYTGDYRIKFIMLYGDEASYDGMAKKYREYLVNNGTLTALENTKSDIPMYVETLGAIDTTTRILGVPVKTTTALTTFQDTIDLLNVLKENEISNVKIKLSGWINGGLEKTVTNEVDIEKVLGDEKGFAELVNYAKENDISLYPDLDFVFVEKDEWFDGFGYKHDSVKTIDNRSAKYRTYDPLSQAYKSAKKIFLSPRVVANFYASAYKDYQLLNVGGISVASLGEILNSDFYKDDPLNREDSKTFYTRLMTTIEENNENVMISGGNAYMLAYVDDITNVALEDSRSIYSAASVPFLGMVLHGYITFSGTALNLAGDYQYTLLKTIENGAVPYFVLAIRNTSELKTSDFTEYYSVRYSIWIDDIMKTYHTLNDLLSDVQYSPIESHDFISKDYRVVKVTFENGISFYINYTLEDYVYKIYDEDGKVTQTITVPAEGYLKYSSDGQLVAASK